MKILVVEDDRKVAGFIEQGLKEEGYVVDVAPDGDEGTMLAHVYDYDVILLDVVLPKKNGFQVATELRREGRNTPILMLTSRDAVEDVVRGLDAGADDYLSKPFRFDELLARVRALQRRGGAERLDVLRYGPVTLDRLRHVAAVGDGPPRHHAEGVPAARVLPAASGGGRPPDHAPGEGMGHALRPGEQRGGRARRESPPQADARRPGSRSSRRCAAWASACVGARTRRSRPPTDPGSRRARCPPARSLFIVAGLAARLAVTRSRRPDLVGRARVDRPPGRLAHAARRGVRPVRGRPRRDARHRQRSAPRRSRSPGSSWS